MSLVGPPGPVTAAPRAGAPDAGTWVEGQNRAGPRMVTLLTGDRVIVMPGGKIAIEPGTGRRGMTFRTYHSRTHMHVVPGDAVGLVRAGRLDARLFDVTALLEYGYDKRDNLPLIVTRVRRPSRSRH